MYLAGFTLNSVSISIYCYELGGGRRKNKITLPVQMLKIYLIILISQCNIGKYLTEKYIPFLHLLATPVSGLSTSQLRSMEAY